MRRSEEKKGMREAERTKITPMRLAIAASEKAVVAHMTIFTTTDASARAISEFQKVRG